MSETLPAKPEDVEKAPIKYNGRGVQLQSFDDAWRLSNAIVKSGMAPKEFNAPAKVLIALQYGAELGLPPMQSLQSIAVINGRPCLWGDALPALVHSSGKCEYINEEMIGDKGTDEYGCQIESKRNDQDVALRTLFTVGDAKAAGLWGKRGPWSDYPDRMLKMRARSFNLRDNFADILRGFGVTEEIQDYAPAIDSDRPTFDPDECTPAEDDPILTAVVEAEVVSEGDPELFDGSGNEE